MSRTLAADTEVTAGVHCLSNATVQSPTPMLSPSLHHLLVLDREQQGKQAPISGSALSILTVTVPLSEEIARLSKSHICRPA